MQLRVTKKLYGCLIVMVVLLLSAYVSAKGLSIELMLNLAEIGNHSAQYNIGVKYYQGKEVEQNLIEAYAWFSLAAESGDEKFLQTLASISKKLSEDEKELARIRAQVLSRLHGIEVLNMSLIPELVNSEQPYCNIEAISKYPPKYPKKAIGKNLQGWVDMEFTIDKYGQVRDPIVVRSQPQNVFDRNSLRAVLKFKYQPPTINGIPTEVISHRSRISYEFSGRDSNEFKRRLEAYRKELLEKAQQGDPQYQYLYPYVMNSYSEYASLDKSETNEWYLKSAQSGYSEAQYALGINLLYGEGCVADHGKAIEWLTVAAKNNHPYAQTLLARALLQVDRDGGHMDKVLFWLGKASDTGYVQAQLFLAWLLATHKDEKIRDIERAKALIEMAGDDYPDEARLFETRAAVYAGLGEFKEAVEQQEKAIKWAEKYDWHLDEIHARLAVYKADRPWRETQY